MATVYRFLPWTRRGLAAALPDGGADGGSFPQRPEVAVKVTVTGAGDAETKALLHGPGDVVGIDPNQVVRTYPRPYTTDAEPNYLAAVDLDAPELPWLFTPRGAPTSGHLPPWLVLVVVEDRPGVGITVPAGAPLPQLRIESGAAAELPDLAGSWAWAHVQLVEPTGGAASPQAVADALGDAPDRNVARIVCPRRLAAGRRWIAALVPAFDAGRVRGMGGTPPTDAPVGPAWGAAPDSVTLPVYFHWEFQTGPEGDFESLAQRLVPHVAADDVGLVPMHIGDAAPPLHVPDGQPRGLPMDGALRATIQEDGRLDQVPAALRDGLQEVSRTLADAADGVLDGQVLQDASRQPVGPPVYASSHVRRWRVADTDPTWFRELNLDPRPRVAAGLGAECVRENQEDIANAAWRQVGDVVAAQTALQRAALSELVSRSFFRRHVEPMPADRLLPMIGPMAARTPFAGVSVVASVRRSSLPDAVVDGGLRRALAPAGRAVSRAAVRAGVATADLRTGLVASLARGRDDVDPTRFARPVLSGVRPESLAVGSLVALGLPVAVTSEVTSRLVASARALTAAPAGSQRERLSVRGDVRTVGLLGQAHVEAARTLAGRTQEVLGVAVAAGATPTMATVSEVATAAMLDDITVDAARALAVEPAAGAGIGLLVEGPAVDRVTAALVVGEAPVRVGVLDLDAGSTLVLRTPAGRQNTPVAVLETSVSGFGLSRALSRLPADVVRRPDIPGAAAREDLPVVRAGGAAGREAGFSPVLRDDAARSGVRPAAAGVPPVVRPVGRPPVGRPPALRPPVVAGPGPGAVVVPDPVVVGPGRPVGAGGRPTVVVPPLIRDAAVIARFETALSLQRTETVIAVAPPVASMVPFDVVAATAAVRAHADPSVAQPLRRDAGIAFAGKAVGSLRAVGQRMRVDGWWATRALDRVMAYPTFPVAASDYLSRYDPTRFCPGIDTIPTDTVSLLETNPRFIAAFMAGLNHETNRELLWRGFPTDSRGTPFRHFWRRLDGRADVPPVHEWHPGTLAEQTTDPKGNLVLLIRGDLLRRYPNTICVALPALGPRTPDHAKVMPPVFSGQFDPDVSYFGFPLVDSDLRQGEGWFFALMEPVTEPRFGLDETTGGPAGGGAAGADDARAWPDTGVEPGGHLGTGDFSTLGLNPAASGADDVAATLFQKPFALYVHAKHLVPEPQQ